MLPFYRSDSHIKIRYNLVEIRRNEIYQLRNFPVVSKAGLHKKMVSSTAVMGNVNCLISINRIAGFYNFPSVITIHI